MNQEYQPVQNKKNTAAQIKGEDFPSVTVYFKSSNEADMALKKIREENPDIVNEFELYEKTPKLSTAKTSEGAAYLTFPNIRPSLSKKILHTLGIKDENLITEIEKNTPYHCAIVAAAQALKDANPEDAERLDQAVRILDAMPIRDTKVGTDRMLIAQTSTAYLTQFSIGEDNQKAKEIHEKVREILKKIGIPGFSTDPGSILFSDMDRNRLILLAGDKVDFVSSAINQPSRNSEEPSHSSLSPLSPLPTPSPTRIVSALSQEELLNETNTVLEMVKNDNPLGQLLIKLKEEIQKNDLDRIAKSRSDILSMMPGIVVFSDPIKLENDAIRIVNKLIEDSNDYVLKNSNQNLPKKKESSIQK